jgi:hypothetical protein
LNGLKKILKHDILAKKTFSTINKDPAKLYLVIKHGISIYPVSAGNKKWYVEVNNNGNVKKYNKTVLDAELEEAIWKTINHYYKLLNEKK